jgi:hypothetical protein
VSARPAGIAQMSADVIWAVAAYWGTSLRVFVHIECVLRTWAWLRITKGTTIFRHIESTRRALLSL